MDIDWAILHWIQATLACPALDLFLSKITVLGNGGAIWIAAGVVLLLTKKYRKFGALLLIALALGGLLGNLTLKPLVARPRPCWLDPSIALLISNPSGFSFPSGHALSSAIGATVLTLANRKFGLVAIPLAAIIAFSRLYLYVHFPTDVLAGILLGITIGLIVVAAGKRICARLEKRLGAPSAPSGTEA